jgi:hypothetical protein
MRVEILFVPGCPNYEPAIKRVKKVLASEAVPLEVKKISVNTDDEARALLFSGSPTIRINGDDVEPAQNSAPALTCRLYANRTGVPSEEALRSAVARAKRVESLMSRSGVAATQE